MSKPTYSGAKMAAPMLEEGLVNSDDYYAILNSRKEATSDELRAAYRRMCVLYHPDKHINETDKTAAEAIFNKVQKAYQVLNDPSKRAIYDVYGEKGLEAEWDVVPRRRTPQEIREEYERLAKEREERRLQQSTNPRGAITVGIDATDLFDVYEDYDMEFSGIPSIEIKNMSITQSIDAPLTSSDTAVLSGNLSTQNGNGSGNFNISYRRIFSYQSWGEFQVSAGGGPSLALKMFRNLNKRSFATCTGSFRLLSGGIVAPGLATVAGRQLDKHTMGYLTWRWGMASSMTTMVVRDTQSTHAMCQVQLGIPNSFISVSFTKKFPEHDGKITVAAKAGLLGSVFEYGCDKKISRHSRLAAKISIGIPAGVILRVRLARGSQTFLFPIHLSHELSPQAVFYGTVAPLLAYWFIKVLVVDPFLNQQKTDDAAKEREAKQTMMEMRKQEAQAELHLMQEMVQRIVEVERNREGLIITRAWYGKLVIRETSEDNGEEGFGGALDGAVGGEIEGMIDVTVQLQCQVKDSKLILTDASKASLPGFYDPCLGEEKNLRVQYEFHSELHECTVADSEPLRIPKRSHHVNPS
ncbi:dnaJ homolog subfamily C member 11-like [Acanthaster planci]|uniref:DnaJ homolog subfamily C member 11-like n=1 Tax=Acanthaster planci TaxID=133434 RepID=A0A8B7Z4Q8_ACAPL|nr:dnaJ homolog subfamily C member 11-like [Acanthaster planci]